MNMTKKTVAALAAVLFAGSAAMAANNQFWLKQTIEGQIVEEGVWSPLRVKSEIENSTKNGLSTRKRLSSWAGNSIPT